MSGEANKSAPKPAAGSDYVERRGPSEFNDPDTRNEFRRAFIWIGTLVAFALIALLAQPLLLIVGGLVIACMLDGGTRLLGRVLPLPRWARLTLVILLVFAFIGWTIWFAGSQLAQQAALLPAIVETQIDRIGGWATDNNITATPEDLKSLGSQLLSGVGRFTAAITSVIGGVTSMALMTVLGIFIAAEPRLYERGLGWLLPMGERSYFYGTLDHMAFTMRRLMAGRLLGMVIEGFGTWFLLWLGNVPMAALLGLLTGLLAFLPNIGSIISGALIILVGFSAGWETGVYAFGVYLAVQIIDGNIIVPMVAKRTVDLAPALVLGAQLIFGALFGILGLALADPIVAMLKIALERQSARGGEEPPPESEPAPSG